MAKKKAKENKPNAVKFPLCNRCQKDIQDAAFVVVQPAIILQKYFAQTPPLFKCPEHAENFTKNMVFHSDCWMDELRDHNVPIHNMTKIIQQYAKSALKNIMSGKEG